MSSVCEGCAACEGQRCQDDPQALGPQTSACEGRHWEEKLPSWIQSIVRHLPDSSKCSGAYLVLFGIAILIGIYWVIMLLIYGYSDMVNHDPLNVKVMDVPMFPRGLSVWPISHYILFLILGILFPHCDIIIIGAGILWEVFEMLLGAFIGSGMRQPLRQTTTSSVEYRDNWWGGSIQDIVMDIAGFYTGKMLALNLPILQRRPACSK